MCQNSRIKMFDDVKKICSDSDLGNFNFACRLIVSHLLWASAKFAYACYDMNVKRLAITVSTYK